ncbi:hypothetical protein [Paraburkholderia heleia]|nr:hypothetical protein [Paraburkholderia heleia]
MHLNRWRVAQRRGERGAVRIATHIIHARLARASREIITWIIRGTRH